MRRFISFILPLLAVATAGAAAPPRGPLHHKSSADLKPVYLASDSSSRLRATANSGVLQPYAVLPLPESATAAAGQGGWSALGTNAQLVKLGWSESLTVTQTLPALLSPSALAIGDLNGDARLDLAALQRPANQLAVASGAANGSLLSPVQRGLLSDTEALLAADLNADCLTDAAYTALDNTVDVLPQLGDHTLGAARTALFANGGASDLTAGDFNHDGQLDLAALRGTGNVANHIGLYTLTNDTLISTGQRRADDGDFAAHAVASGDVTGDGRADLVVGAGGNHPDAYINIFAQQPDGLLATTPVTLTAWHIPESIAVADLDHDGHNDVVALHSGWLALTLYRGQADGSLAPYEEYALPYSAAYRPETLALTDLNGDGGLDVLIADGSRGATYLLNSAGAPTATIDGPAPCARLVGRTLRLNGTLANGDAVEISLDGGATWEAATVTSAAWEYTADLSDRAVYKRVMARAISGNRVQAPVAEQYLRIYNYQTFAPTMQK
ncbi:MAG: VCBS repeat-containing protein [Chloroflexi bacterium]|nr:VCBS repeat-containing protein [Chloroflexota bacterium]